MKYPKLIDTLLYKRVDDLKYHVKNAETGEIFELGSAIVSFMNKLDGKTDPYEVYTDLSASQIEVTLSWLLENELITEQKLKKVGFLSYGVPLFKVKSAKHIRIILRILNFFLMISFIPVFITGLFAVKDIYRLVNLDILYLIGIYSGLILGVILHELGHAQAALGYNAHVFNFGIIIGIMPGAFVEIDDDHIKSPLKKAQISGAGIEINLWLCGLAMLSMRLFNSASLFSGMAFINLLLSLVNLLPIKGVDGAQILNKLVGNDLIIYSTVLIRDKSFLKHSFSTGIMGWAEIYSCVLTLLSQISHPILIIANILYIWSAL